MQFVAAAAKKVLDPRSTLVVRDATSGAIVMPRGGT